MKYTIISILVLGVLLFLVACKSKKVTTPSATELGDPTMTLAKSTCFGKCKVFNLKIYANKAVSYEGIQNVENIGMFRSTMTDADYQSLIALFEAADFKNLDATYLTGVRDKQKTTLSFSQKEVRYQSRAASPELKAITKSMDAIIEKLKWEKE